MTLGPGQAGRTWAAARAAWPGGLRVHGRELGLLIEQIRGVLIALRRSHGGWASSGSVGLGAGDAPSTPGMSVAATIRQGRESWSVSSRRQCMVKDVGRGRV